MGKKLVSLLLAAAIGISAAQPETAAVRLGESQTAAVITAEEDVTRTCLAAGDTKTKNGLLFTLLDDGTYEVGYNYKGSKPVGKVTIPEIFSGKKVTRIAEAGFANCEELTSISLPDSVIGAGANAFRGTALLDRQSGPIKYAGKIAVYCDDNAVNVSVKAGTLGLADKLFYRAESLEKAVLPKGLLNIGSMTFQNCSKLKSVNIPSGLTTIGSGVFAECTSLGSITLPAGIKNIGSYAFYKTALTTVKIPSSVVKIGKSAFESTKLKTNGVTIGNQYIDMGGRAFADTVYMAEKGNLKYVGSVLAECSPTITSVSVKKGTTAIADMAFANCASLKSVTLPAGIKTIGADAFFACGALTSVNIPEGVTSIGEDAFRLCVKLNTVTLPKSLKIINLGTFYGCSKIKAVNFNGSAANWAKVSVKGENTPLLKVTPTAALSPKKPAAPTKLKATTTTSAVTISWDKVDIATSYQVDMLKNGEWTAVSTPKADTTSCTVSGLSSNRSYQFRVFAFAKNIFGASAKITAKTKIAAPKSFKASAKSTSAALSWQTVKSADSYRIETLKNNTWTTVTTLSGSRTSYTIKNLTPNTSYAFRIAAYINKERGSAAKVSVKTAKAAAVPAAVKNLKATAAANSLSLSWSKNTSAKSYRVYIYKNDKWEKLADVNGTSYNVTGLSAAMEYRLRVYAKNDAGFSKYTGITAETRPAAVTNLKASVSSNSIKLSWKKSPRATLYQIDTYKNGVWVYVGRTSKTSFTVSGLAANTTHEFKVYTFKGSNYSSSARISASTTSAAGTPAAVKSAAASTNSDTATLSWTGNGADSYQISRYISGQWKKLGTTSNTSYTVSGLKASASYKFRIYAVVKGKLGKYTQVGATTKPSAVSGLAASAGETSVKLSWKKNSSADSYRITYLSDGKWVTLGKTSNTSYTVKNLSAGSSYKFRVYSVKGTYSSAAANISAKTKKAAAAANALPAQAAAATAEKPEPAGLSSVNVFLKGIDVSGYQGEIDFNKVKAAGVDYVIIKAGYSTSTVDTWEKNYANAKKAGLMVGAYWYSIATTVEQGKAEAAAFLKAMKGKKFEFPVYFDMEELDQFNQGKAFCTDLVEAFCGTLEKAGYCAGVYCSTYWFTNYVDENVRLKRPVWIADYRNRCYYNESCGMWQYDIGNVDGVQYDCDLDFGYVDYSIYIKAHHLNGF